MRFNVGATKKLISSDCFRLLSLVPEVQNDVEVVKPVLEELEVMRLSCSLGMLSSVNPKDFEMEMLEAREFDDDFAIFLRKEIFGTDDKREAGGVKVVSLFGKQASVCCELERLQCWSEEMESNLKAEDQGIYCVTCGANTEEPSLVLFSWIQDRWFRKSRLRDTATYVLRFLTCLSPDMVCCLSDDDVELLERTVASMNSSNLDAWKSFSVAFHVERQEEQKDAVGCESLTSIRLPGDPTTHKIQLLKGSYPAFSVVEPAPAMKWTERWSHGFDSVKEFASWLQAESKERNLRIELDGKGSELFVKEGLLKATGQWPEEELVKAEEMTDRSLQTSEEQARDRSQAYIEEYRATLLGHIDNLFDLDLLYKGAKGEPAFVTLNKSVQDVQENRDIWSKVDAETQATLNLPLRLKNQLKAIASKFRDHVANVTDGEDVAEPLAKFMHDFTVSDKKVVDTSDGFFERTLKKVFGGRDTPLLSDKFRECMAKPLDEACQAWFDAVETVLTIADKARQKTVYCDIQKEHWKPATDQMKVFKLVQNDNGSYDKIELGTHRLEPDAKILKAFTIKSHCMVLVTTSPRGTLVERVDFPLDRSWWNSSIGNVTFKRPFGRSVSLCDFNVHERVVAFVEEGGGVNLYRFNETFSSLEIYKRVELSLRTSLVLPVVDVLVVEGTLYATDSEGSIQSVNLRNQQTSRAVQIMPSGSRMPNGSLFAMADNMVLGFVAQPKYEDKSDAKQDSALFAVASEDFRDVPVAHSGYIALPSRGLSVQCFDDVLFAADDDLRKICVCRLTVTVRSESFRIQHSKEHSVNGTKTESDELDAEVDHWLRAFYHTYEKFPVRGLIRSVNDTRATLKVHLACSSVLTKPAEERCRSFFQALMRDLRKLNKPLGGMDLARDLGFLTKSNTALDVIAAQPLRSFLQELVTFVPIQICRAEGNSLTVMTNGKAQPMGTHSQDVQAVDIARSIRFGLLSPLLESWQGRCVVITSMGKQSTGKSYLLNHLTGSSFAIAGARCTDGAWMAIRILPGNVLLVVLDFEGLGSFERTEQEDVFLSVLNASISMFTIFRMEMRYDKEVDDLFARFQKGVALIKGDASLFRGKLYMSVKDVNPNDQKGVLDEFVAKFQKLVGTNKDSNFLLDLYSGQLDINCSPPLGTINYYQSLMHAQNFIETSLCGVETAGFRSGKTFLNCIRLVLAKIAILDWTSLDEGAKQFQLSEISSKLPGLLRTGCIIPQEYVSKAELGKISILFY